MSHPDLIDKSRQTEFYKRGAAILKSWHYRLADVTQIVKIPNSINVYCGTPTAITTISKKKGIG